MPPERNMPLADCREFRQTLLARPPVIVHGTIFLLMGLIGSLMGWAALTQADLVVRASGRIRPVTTPTKVTYAARGETLSASTGGRVVAVYFREGNQVQKGDVLLRLDTGHLDNEISRRKRTIETGEEELLRLSQLEKLLLGQAKAALAKAQAELTQAVDEVRLEKERKEVDVRMARVEVLRTADEFRRTSRLASQRAATQAALVTAQSQYEEAKEKLEKAQLPVDESKVQLCRKAVDLAKSDAALKQEELTIRRTQKRGETDAARLELANLQLERGQAELRAPIDGIVTSGDLKVGDVLEAGKVAVEIAPQRGFHFEATVAGEDVAHLRVGMSARIKLDAFDYQRYGTLAGTVSFISPDSGFTDRPQATYLVRIEVEGEEVGRGDLRGQIKLGMAGQADIVTQQESLLLLLTRNLRQAFSLR
jgi:multidrug resistance efflux pump